MARSIFRGEDFESLVTLVPRAIPADLRLFGECPFYERLAFRGLQAAT